MEILSNVYSHSRTNAVITDRNVLNDRTLCEIRRLLPEEERYALKYVAVCLEDGVPGQVDRECLAAILEMFGQIRDSGVSPRDILRELKNKTDKIAPAVSARRVAGGDKAVRAGEAGFLGKSDFRKPARRKSSKRRDHSAAAN